MKALIGQVRRWLLAARPKTLTASLVPVLVATALVPQLEAPWISVFAFLAALFIQVGTNLFNDVFDFKKGADDDSRLGPRRVTQSGLLTPRQVTLMAGFSFLLAMAFGIPLVIKGGAPIVTVGLISLTMGYAYTGGPFPLAYLGLGDFFVVIFFGLVAVSGVFFLHVGHLNADVFVGGLQVGFLATVLIAVNNLRDMEQDRKANKRTLAVRMGPRFLRWEIFLLLAGAFGLGVYWALTDRPLAALLPLVAWPTARKVIQGVSRHEPSPLYNHFLAQAALVHLIFGLQLSLGLALHWS